MGFTGNYSRRWPETHSSMYSKVRDEEYPILAFGISWLTDHVLSDNHHRGHVRPQCLWVNEKPFLGAATYDLIYWWHKKILTYGEEIQSARIDLLIRSNEDAIFSKEAFQNFGDMQIGEASATLSPWTFRVSRVGIDSRSRIAIAHFLVNADSMWLNYGYTLKMGWGDDDVIFLIQSFVTDVPGK